MDFDKVWQRQATCAQQPPGWLLNKSCAGTIYLPCFNPNLMCLDSKCLHPWP